MFAARYVSGRLVRAVVNPFLMANSSVSRKADMAASSERKEVNETCRCKCYGPEEEVRPVSGQDRPRK